MLQLMDLARENAALKYELERIRQEAEELRRSAVDGSAQTSSGASAAPRFWYIVLGGTEEV